MLSSSLVSYIPYFREGEFSSLSSFQLQQQDSTFKTDCTLNLFPNPRVLIVLN